MSSWIAAARCTKRASSNLSWLEWEWKKKKGKNNFSALLEEFLARNGPVCKRVDGVHHQVRLAVVLQLKAVTMATRPDGLHNHLGAGDLVLDVTLQDTGNCHNAIKKKAGAGCNRAIRKDIRHPLASESINRFWHGRSSKSGKRPCCDLGPDDPFPGKERGCELPLPTPIQR